MRRASPLGMLMLLIGGGTLAYVAIASQDEMIAQTLDRLAAYEATIATRPQLEAQLASVQQQSASLAGLIPATSAALAAAAIQNDVRTIVTRVGGQVRSTQNLPPSSIDGFEKIEIACEVSVPVSRLKEFLYQIETQTPYLFLDRLVTELPQNPPPEAERAQQRMDLRFVVRGYRWTGT